MLKIGQRDFEYWFQKAQKALIRSELKEVNAIRIAFSDDAYRQFNMQKSMLLDLLSAPPTREQQKEIMNEMRAIQNSRKKSKPKKEN